MYFFISLVLILLLFYLIYISREVSITKSLKYLPTCKYLLVIPLFTFVYGLFPHIGLKNIQVMAMYSNLKTEGGVSNHLFIPSSLQVFDKLNNLVEIKSSSLRGLDKFSGYTTMRPISNTTIKYPKNYINYQKNKEIEIKEKYKFRFPLAKIQNIITNQAEKGAADIELSYILNNKQYSFRNAETDPFLSNASLFQRKFLALGAVPVDD